VTEEAVSLMSGTAPLIVVSLAVGSVLEVRAVDEEFTRAASVLAEEVVGAGFLSLAEVEDSLVVSLKVTFESKIVAGVGVMVDDIVEATTLLSVVVETGVITAEGADVGVGLLEVAVEVAELVEEVVAAGMTSIALLVEVLDLVMVKEVS